MTENERQQRMIERIQEDERLRGDLEDPAATALINWASARAAAAAADPARSDDAVEADLTAVRQATRAAARSGETDPERLIAIAEATLAKSRAPAQGAAVASPPSAPVHASSTAPVADEKPAAGLSVGQEPAAVVAASPSAPEVEAASETSHTSPQPAPADRRPAGSNGQSQRKRRRLARYLKRIVGDR